MLFFVQVGIARMSPETTVGFLAIVGLGCLAIWGFIRWLLSGPCGPDPWDAETSTALAQGQATPLCHRCLAPNDPEADFCTECGATIGQYTNWLPYPYIFSLGHTLRLGAAGEFKRSPLTVWGFLFLALAEYSVFAPVYWFVFLRKLARGDRPPGPAGENATIGGQ